MDRGGITQSASMRLIPKYRFKVSNFDSRNFYNTESLLASQLKVLSVEADRRQSMPAIPNKTNSQPWHEIEMNEASGAFR